MKRINATQNVVQAVLEENPITRNSDDELYLGVIRKLNPVALDLPYQIVISQRKDFDLPKYSSVSRARRKVQEKCDWLRACKEVEDGRYEEFKLAKEYALQ